MVGHRGGLWFISQKRSSGYRLAIPLGPGNGLVSAPFGLVLPHTTAECRPAAGEMALLSRLQSWGPAQAHRVRRQLRDALSSVPAEASGVGRKPGPDWKYSLTPV